MCWAGQEAPLPPWGTPSLCSSPAGHSHCFLGAVSALSSDLSRACEAAEGPHFTDGEARP